VSRGQQAQAETLADQRDMERDGLQAVFRETKPAAQQSGGQFRAQDGVMAGEVIGMGVGDEGTRFGIPWVQPQVRLRQIKAALEANFD